MPEEEGHEATSTPEPRDPVGENERFLLLVTRRPLAGPHTIVFAQTYHTRDALCDAYEWHLDHYNINQGVWVSRGVFYAIDALTLGTTQPLSRGALLPHPSNYPNPQPE